MLNKREQGIHLLKCASFLIIYLRDILVLPFLAAHRLLLKFSLALGSCDNGRCVAFCDVSTLRPGVVPVDENGPTRVPINGGILVKCAAAGTSFMDDAVEATLQGRQCCNWDVAGSKQRLLIVRKT